MKRNDKATKTQGVVEPRQWVLSGKEAKQDKTYYINSDGTCTVVHEDAVAYKQDNRLQ